MVRRFTGDTVPRRLEGFPGGEWAYRFSPDGRWLVYATLGPAGEVYVRPFPGPGARVQISQGGGAEPVWSPDGARIYYRDQSGRAFFAANVRAGSTLEVTGRAKLFEGNFDYEWVVASYDVSRTGRELLLGRFTNPESELRIAVNWRQELRDRVKPAR